MTIYAWSFDLFLAQVRTTWDRSTTHPKFDPTGVQTHDLQIMTVHHVTETPALTLSTGKEPMQPATIDPTVDLWTRYPFNYRCGLVPEPGVSGTLECKVCPTLLYITSTGNRAADLLISVPYPLGWVLRNDWYSCKMQLCIYIKQQQQQQ